MNGSAGAYFVPVARRLVTGTFTQGSLIRPIKALCFLRASAELLNLHFFLMYKFCINNKELLILYYISSFKCWSWREKMDSEEHSSNAVAAWRASE